MWSDLKSGKVLPSQAIEMLVAEGENRDEAGFSVFLTMGGGDEIKLDENGVECYCPSMKPCAEVDAKMEL